MNLTELLKPHDVESFTRDFWEQRPLLIADRSADFYSEMFSLADADRILSSPLMFASMIQLIEHEMSLPLDRINDAAAPEIELSEVLFTRYHEGATLSFTALERVFPALRKLASELGRQVSARFQINAYLTPPLAQGLPTHTDTHDVFVLQLAGVKRWTVFEPEYELPLAESPRPTQGSGQQILKSDLAPGDLLYIPRGFPHHAVSADATSLHLTVGAHPSTWALLLRAAVEDAIAGDRRLRTALPVGFAADQSTRTAASAQLRGLLDEVFDDIDPAALIDDAADSVSLHHLAVPTRRLFDVDAESGIDEDSEVVRRNDVECTLRVDGEHVHLGFNGKTVSMPAAAESELRGLLETENATARLLPGEIDSAGRVVLIKRLIREGLLTPAADTQPVG